MALINCPECKKQISETIENCPHCGYKFSSGETKKIKEQQKKSTVIGFVVLVVIIFILFKLCSSGDKPESKTPWDQKDNSAGAWVYTQMYVKNNLKSPSTAKFPWGYTDYVQRNGTTYTIKSYVDSENSFGAMIRTYFNATVREVSEDNWKMISFEFIE